MIFFVERLHDFLLLLRGSMIFCVEGLPDFVCAEVA